MFNGFDDPHTWDQALGTSAWMFVPGVGAASKTAGASSVGKRASTSTKGITGFRYMTEGEINAVKTTNLLRGGNPGETYFTKDLYKSATKTQQRLALPTAPTHRVEFQILNNPILQFKRIKSVA